MLDDPTVEQVRELLVRAVEEKGPDYVYPGAAVGQCRYLDRETREPSCIVGHVLTWAGVEIFPEHEGTSAWGVAPSSWDGDLRVALLEAQVVQDGGKSWGEALAAFDQRLGLVQS